MALLAACAMALAVSPVAGQEALDHNEIQVVPIGKTPPTSLRLGQPFKIVVRVPDSSDPDTDTLHVSIHDPNRGDPVTVTLKAQSHANGVTTYSTPEPVSIGGERGGLDFDGTINDLNLENGNYLTARLEGFAGDTHAYMPVYDTKIQQSIALNTDALKRIGESLVRQTMAIRNLKKQNLSPGARDDLGMWQHDVETKLSWLTEARRVIRKANTPRRKLIAGNAYVGMLAHDFLQSGDDPRDVHMDTVSAMRESMHQSAIDTFIDATTAYTLAEYHTVTHMTLAAQAYTAGQLITDPLMKWAGYDTGPAVNEMGQRVTTGQQVEAAAEIGGAIVMMRGLPRLTEWLAGRGMLSGAKTPTTIPEGGVEVGGAGEAPATGEAPTVRMPAPETGTPTVTNPPPDETPTVRLPSPNPATTPTVRTGPETGTPTVTNPSPDETPTVTNPSPDETPTVINPSPDETPTVINPPSAADASGRPVTGNTGGDTEQFTEPDMPPAARPNSRIGSEEALELYEEEQQELLDQYNSELDQAQAAGVPQQVIDQITAGAEPGDPDVTFRLMQARMEAQGFDLSEPPPLNSPEFAENIRLRTILVRMQTGMLTEDDIAWIQDRLAADPEYFQHVGQRAYVRPENWEIERAFTDEDVARLEERFGHGQTAHAATGSAPAGVDAEGDTVIMPPSNQPPAPPGSGTEILPPPDLPPEAPAGRPATGGSSGGSAASGSGRSLKPPKGGAAITHQLLHTLTGGDDRKGSASGGGSTTAVSVGGGVNTSRGLPDITFAMAPGPRTGDTRTFVDPPPIVDLTNGPPTGVDVRLPGGGGVASRDPLVQPMIIEHIGLELGGTPVSGRANGRRNGVAGLLWRGLHALAALLPGATPLASLGPAARPVWRIAPGAQGGGLRAVAGGARIVLASLGRSTGQAFEMRVLGQLDQPIRLAADSLVVEPLKKQAQAAIEKQLARFGAPRLSVKLTAYCVDFTRHPPTPGTLFRIASPALQQQFAPLRRILDVSRQLQQAGMLHPDSDPAGYFHSIRQWAIWTTQQHYDLKSFGRAFVARTKQNLAALKQNWTPAIAAAVQHVVPGRWRDITLVLHQAGYVTHHQTAAAASAAGGHF